MLARSARLLPLGRAVRPLRAAAAAAAAPASGGGDPVRVTAAGLPPADADALADTLLFADGVLSVSLAECRAGGRAETPVFRDGAPPRADGDDAPPPLWPRVALTAVLAPEADVDAVMASAAADAGVAQAPVWSPPEPAPAAEWEAALRGAFVPVRCGEGVWIVPEGDAVPAEAAAEDGAVVVRVTPGLAFGTGAHPTTRLCCEWLAAHRHDLRTAPLVLDYGTGSGVLAAAAALLGAAAVVATDVEPQAVAAAAATAAANGVASSVTVVQVDPTPAALPAALLPPGSAGVVVANILAGPLAALAPLLASAAAPGARVALSGILAGEQADSVIAAYAGCGVELGVGGEREGWVLLEGGRLCT